MSTIVKGICWIIGLSGLALTPLALSAQDLQDFSGEVLEREEIPERKKEGALIAHGDRTSLETGEVDPLEDLEGGENFVPLPSSKNKGSSLESEIPVDISREEDLPEGSDQPGGRGERFGLAGNERKGYGAPGPKNQLAFVLVGAPVSSSADFGNKVPLEQKLLWISSKFQKFFKKKPTLSPDLLNPNFSDDSPASELDKLSRQINRFEFSSLGDQK